MRVVARSVAVLAPCGALRDGRGSPAHSPLAISLKAATIRWNAADRAIPGDRQHLLRRHQRACVLPDHDAAGPCAHRYGACRKPTRRSRATSPSSGSRLSDIKYLLNTHAHLDHTAGFAELKRETGAQLICGERDKPLLEGGFYPGRESAKELGFPPVKVDRTVKDGDIGQPRRRDADRACHARPLSRLHQLGIEREGRQTRRARCSSSAAPSVALNRLVPAPTYPGIVDDYKKTFAWAKRAEPGCVPCPASRKCTACRRSGR